MNIEMQLRGDQFELMDSRASRIFLKCHSEEKILKDLENAKDLEAVEYVAMRNGVCDFCNLSGICLDAAISLVRVAVHISFTFPKIRSHLCFLGSKKGYINALNELRALNRETIKKFQIQHICPDSVIIDMANEALTMIEETDYDGKRLNVLAQAFSLYGLLDAIILDDSDFRGFKYRSLLFNLKLDSLARFAPKGCDTVDSIIYHEFGHIFDFMIDINGDAEFISYYNSCTKEQIKKGLSEYATTDAYEFFAEAFAEYMCSEKPREIATYLGEFFKKKYK